MRNSPTSVRVATVVVAVAAGLVLAWWRAGGSTVVVTQAVVTAALLGGVYGLVAMGLTLIFGVLDIVNFAHGALMTVAMYVTWTLARAGGADPYLTLLASIPLLALLGAAVQRGLLNRTMGAPLENPLLLTLGVALLVENALLLGFGGEPKGVDVGYARPLAVLGAVADLTRVIAFAGAVAVAAALYVLLRRTRTGTVIRAVAANAEGARLVGIDVGRVHVAVFALGTACAAAAGTLVVPFVTVEPTAGELFNIIAFVVVVLGGMGNVLGALAGGFLVSLAQQLGGIYFPGQSPLLAVFVVFVVVLFVRPQGLFGRADG